jgi:branched-chain amino acid aminotransferase
VKDGVVSTPPLSDHILASITRAQVMLVTEVTQRSCTIDELKAADEVFIASTSREVQDVAAVDEREFPATGPVFKGTAAALRAYVAAELSRA